MKRSAPNKYKSSGVIPLTGLHHCLKVFLTLSTFPPKAFPMTLDFFLESGDSNFDVSVTELDLMSQSGVDRALVSLVLEQVRACCSSFWKGTCLSDQARSEETLVAERWNSIAVFQNSFSFSSCESRNGDAALWLVLGWSENDSFQRRSACTSRSFLVFNTLRSQSPRSFLFPCAGRKTVAANCPWLSVRVLELALRGADRRRQPHFGEPWPKGENAVEVLILLLLSSSCFCSFSLLLSPLSSCCFFFTCLFWKIFKFSRN